jgi:co-chaperonin GroES (HSP10)
MYSANGTLIPIVVNVGDTVLYNKHAHTQEYKLNGEEHVIMSINEVLSVLESN